MLLSQMQLAAASEFNKTDLSTHTHLGALSQKYFFAAHIMRRNSCVERFGSGNLDHLRETALCVERALYRSTHKKMEKNVSA